MVFIEEVIAPVLGALVAFGVIFAVIIFSML